MSTNEFKYCPVASKASQALENGRDLRIAIRELRRSMATCHNCPQREGCTVRLAFRQEISAAIRAVVEEWGLDRQDPPVNRARGHQDQAAE